MNDGDTLSSYTNHECPTMHECLLRDFTGKNIRALADDEETFYIGWGFSYQEKVKFLDRKVNKLTISYKFDAPNLLEIDFK